MRILTVGIDELDYEKFKHHGKCELNKPWGFGLWGSTITKDYKNNLTSGWTNFVECNNFHSEKYSHGISYKLHKKAKIYTVDSEANYIWLLDNYGMNYERHSNSFERCVNWNKFAKDYDAFHLTRDAFYEMRMPLGKEWQFKQNPNGSEIKRADFYSYDCESWIIFNLDCINKGSILNININYDLED